MERVQSLAELYFPKTKINHHMTKRLERSVSTYFTEFLKNLLKEQHPFAVSAKRTEQLL